MELLKCILKALQHHAEMADKLERFVLAAFFREAFFLILLIANEEFVRYRYEMIGHKF